MSFIVAVEMERERADMLDVFRREARADPNVQQCYYVTGAADFILSVVARDMADFEAFTRRVLFDNPNIRHFTTSVVMGRDKITALWCRCSWIGRQEELPGALERMIESAIIAAGTFSAPFSLAAGRGARDGSGAKTSKYGRNSPLWRPHTALLTPFGDVPPSSESHLGGHLTMAYSDHPRRT